MSTPPPPAPPLPYNGHASHIWMHPPPCDSHNATWGLTPPLPRSRRANVWSYFYYEYETRITYPPRVRLSLLWYTRYNILSSWGWISKYKLRLHPMPWIWGRLSCKGCFWVIDMDAHATHSWIARIITSTIRIRSDFCSLLWPSLWIGGTKHGDRKSKQRPPVVFCPIDEDIVVVLYPQFSSWPWFRPWAQDRSSQLCLYVVLSWGCSEESA